MARHSTAVILAIGAGLLLFAVFQARIGFFIIDEAIYLFAADTFRLTGGFLLDNGLDLARSDDLLWTSLLTLGPDGLTSQYPPGTTFVWAPLLSLFGERSVVVLNAAATVGTLFAIRGLALRLFGDPAIAVGACLLFLFATFTLEYAFVYWPHMISVWTIVMSFNLFLDAMDDRRGTLMPAVLSGLVLGAGMLFRLDNVLLLPVFAVLAVLFAVAPLRLLAGGAAGILPAFLLLALVNQQKFGTFNPLSYGGKSGLTNIEVYLPFGGAGIAGLAVMAVFRARPVPRKYWPALAGLCVAACLSLILLLTSVRDLIANYALGSYLLMVDARNTSSGLSGIVPMPDGTTLFWGLAKKALAQSLPWLGLLFLLTRPGLWRGRARSIAIVLIFAAIFSFPFAATAWHGGMSSNMRYFLPLMPFASVLGAVLLKELLEGSASRKRVLIGSVVAGLAAACLWTLLAPSGLAGAHQIWSLYLFFATVVAALAAAHLRLPATAIAALVVGGAGIGTAVFNTASDTLISQLRRDGGRVLTDLSVGYTGKVLVYDVVLRSALVDPDQVVALRRNAGAVPDEVLVRAALAGGYRVLMRDRWAMEFTELHDAYAWRDAEGPLDMAEVFEAVRLSSR